MTSPSTTPQFYGRRIILIVTALSIVLVRLPIFTGHQTVIAPIVLVIFFLCVAWGIPRHKALQSRTGIGIVFAYVALTDITVVRGSLAGVYVNQLHAISDSLMYFSLAALGVLLMTTSRNEVERRQRLAAITLAPGIYALANALLHIAGAQAATVDLNQQGIATLQPASLLKLFHIYIYRAQFPMATGVNSTGIIAGAGLAGCFLLIKYRAAPRWMTWPCVAGCLYCLALGDNRISFAIALIAAIYFSWTRRASAAYLLPVVGPLLPLFIVFGTSLSDSVLGGTFSRGSANDFASAGHRVYIWEAAWNVLRHPSVQQLYGWGANGHITSGLSESYSYLFAFLPHPLAYSTHDIVIQTIFDSGYFGLIILIAAVWVTTLQLIRHIRLAPRSLARAMVAMLTVTLLSGATEASPSYGTQEALVLTLLIMGAAAGWALPIVPISQPSADSTASVENPTRTLITA
jgi:O-Antigen ligase